MTSRRERRKKQSSDNEIGEYENGISTKTNDRKLEPTTSSYLVSPPETFDFKDVAGWQKWIQKFERFRLASGLHKESSAQQVSMLIYSLGDDGEELLQIFGLSDEEKCDYNIVKGKFESYLNLNKNLVYERAKFLKRRQKEGEPINVFINDLHKLAETCELGDLKSSLIRDLIVIGISDTKLSEQLQLDSKLTLSTAIMKVRQADAMKMQQLEIRDPSDHVELINDKKQKPLNRSCFRCGSSFHKNKDTCPAINSKCFSCGLIGHFGRVCRKKCNAKEVNLLDNNQIDNDERSQLGELTVNELENTSQIFVKLDTNKGEINFKVDTGADVSVAGLNLVKHLGFFCQKTTKTLYGPDHVQLKVLGVVRMPLSFKGKMLVEDVYVFEKQKVPLLSGKAALELGLIKVCVNEINNQTAEKMFPNVFQGVGKINHPYKIVIKEGAEPYAVTAPRRISLNLLDQVKQELDSMICQDIIEPITGPSDWCAPIVVVPRKNAKVRICVDYTELNKSVKRERLLLPTVDESLAKLNGGQWFSKLDASNGFWHVPLTEDSYIFTTFITPFGRYVFKRLPFGISSGPEVFQKRMYQVLDGLQGVIVQADDILVVGKSPEEHDQKLRSVLERLDKEGVKLNKSKCVFNVDTVEFLGHLISQSGILPDKSKIEAISSIKEPQNVSDVRKFLGMVNYLMKFVPNLAELSQPLRALTRIGTSWVWGPQQQDAFEKIKHMIVNAPVLAFYNRSAQTRVTTDASFRGLGALLEQFQDGLWKPVMYASKALTETEILYAMIEKEALGVVWACEKFSHFLLGSEFEICTDHKPLLSLLGNKPISDLSPRLQRFRLRLQSFNYRMTFLPGKNNVVADLLSRSTIQTVHFDTLMEGGGEEEKRGFIDSILGSEPFVDSKLDEIRKVQENDAESRYLKNCIEQGKFDKQSVFWKDRDELVFEGGLILKGRRIFVPKPLRAELLSRIHEGHLGIVKCRRRLQETVWWPGCSVEIQKLILNCSTCLEHRVNRSETLIPSKLPKEPWSQVGIDLFKFKDKWFMVIEDYYSRFLELVHIDRLTSATVIVKIKNVFARHGIPLQVRTDGGTQFTSAEFKQFSLDFGFSTVTSSPHYPKSNGEAENAVGRAKAILSKNKDVNLALLVYRTTPLESGLSPAELLYGRKLRSNIPSVDNFLKVPDNKLQEFKTKDNEKKLKNKFYHDNRAGAKDLPPLEAGDEVWITDVKKYGKVKKLAGHPRSYIVQLENGTELRRNRFHLVKSCCKSNFPMASTSSPQIRRSSRTIKPPRRFE